MSDISINLDGVIAFLVALALTLGLLIVSAVLSLRGLSEARRTGTRFSRQRLFPHLLGALVSLSGCLVVLLLVRLSDATPPPRQLDIWLDRLTLFWVAFILALWPMSAYAVRGWQRERALAQSGER